MVCLLLPFTCLSKQLSIDSELPVLTAVKSLSNCKKKMACLALGIGPVWFRGLS